VIIEPYDGLSAPESVELNQVAVWLQIHKLPTGYRDKALIKNLVQKKVGPVSTVETQIVVSIILFVFELNGMFQNLLPGLY
jgi:hypothetical protein